MKVLLMNPSAHEAANLEEFFRGMKCDVFTVNSLQTLSKALLKGRTDLLLFNLKALEDFAVIRYVNDYYPELRIVLLTEKNMGSMIDIVRKGSFGSLCKPYHLEDLGWLLKEQNHTLDVGK